MNVLQIYVVLVVVVVMEILIAMLMLVAMLEQISAKELLEPRVQLLRIVLAVYALVFQVLIYADVIPMRIVKMEISVILLMMYAYKDQILHVFMESSVFSEECVLQADVHVYRALHVQLVRPASLIDVNKAYILRLFQEDV